MSLLKFMSKYSTELNLAANVLGTLIARSGMNKTEKSQLAETISELAAGAARVEAYVRQAASEPSVSGISREEVSSMITAAVNAALESERQSRVDRTSPPVIENQREPDISDQPNKIDEE